MEDFRRKYLNGTLDTFDAVFSYSSLEHSGQGETWLLLLTLYKSHYYNAIMFITTGCLIETDQKYWFITQARINFRGQTICHFFTDT